MQPSRAKSRGSDFFAYQTSAEILTKTNFKHVLFLLIALLIFLASFLPGCKSGSFVAPSSGEEQKTVLIHKIRVTPKDFLFGLNESHPIVRAVNNMTDDVLKGNRMTVINMWTFSEKAILNLRLRAPVCFTR